MTLQAAYLVARPDGRYRDASSAALELLGVDLPTLRGRRVGDFSDPAAQESVRQLLGTWVAQPGTWLTGVTELVRLDGERVRVRFAAIRRPNGDLVTRFDPQTPGEEAEPPAVGNVLEAWRRQERRRTELAPGTEQHSLAEAEAEWLRSEYQRLVLAKVDESDAQEPDGGRRGRS